MYHDPSERLLARVIFILIVAALVWIFKRIVDGPAPKSEETLGERLTRTLKLLRWPLYLIAVLGLVVLIARLTN